MNLFPLSNNPIFEKCINILKIKAMCKFKTGDKVKLISDNDNIVPMTVNSYLKDNPDKIFLPNFAFRQDEVLCDWRDNSSVPYQKYFKENELMLV